jgi:hypothetical protein
LVQKQRQINGLGDDCRNHDCELRNTTDLIDDDEKPVLGRIPLIFKESLDK